MYKNNLKIEKYDQEYQELLSILICNLPCNIYSFKDKNSFNLRYLKPTIKALLQDNFIEYNQKWINFIIIDIDNKDMQKSIELCLNNNIPEPTFACNTNKGCHLFWKLLKPISFTSIKPISFLKDIKESIIYSLDADQHGSTRNKGIWRNPLNHNFIVNSNLFYSLNDFKEIVLSYKTKDKTIQQTFKTYINKTKMYYNNFKYEIGNRNTFLFYNGMLWSKGKNYKEAQIIAFLDNLNIEESNKNNIEKLHLKDIKTIAKSIYKYNKNGKNYISKNEKNNKKNIGIMEFKKMENLTNEEYLKETKERQKKSAARTNNIKNVKKMIETKETNTKNIIYNFVKNNKEKCLKNNGKWNYKKIAQETQLDARTISKHLKDIKDL